MSANINYGMAFAAGLLSFFSPCFIPLVPAYLIYITGLSFEEVKKARLMTVLHSLCFILGFTLVFTSLGAAASLLGRFFYSYGDILRIIGGIFIVILGLYLMGTLKLPFLDTEKRFKISNKPYGYIGSILVGMVFAVGWSPCIGPVLAGILVYASQAETVGQGILLLIAFSFGLGLPLFLVALGVNYSMALFKKIDKYLGVIHFILGSLLVIIGSGIIWDSLNLLK